MEFLRLDVRGDAADLVDGLLTGTPAWRTDGLNKAIVGGLSGLRLREEGIASSAPIAV